VELYPAVDVQGGRVVRLQQGAADRATAYADDPVAVAREFAAAGARWDNSAELAPERTRLRVSDRITLGAESVAAKKMESR